MRDAEGMTKSVEGIYHNGRVELLEPLTETEGSRVIVTWVQPGEAVDLRERDSDEAQADDLCRRLGAFCQGLGSARDCARQPPRLWAGRKLAPQAVPKQNMPKR